MTGAALLREIQLAAGLCYCKHCSLKRQPGLQDSPMCQSGWGSQPGYAVGMLGCMEISCYTRCQISLGESNKISWASVGTACISGHGGTESISFAVQDAHREHVEVIRLVGVDFIN